MPYGRYIYSNFSMMFAVIFGSAELLDQSGSKLKMTVSGSRCGLNNLLCHHVAWKRGFFFVNVDAVQSRSKRCP